MSKRMIYVMPLEGLTVRVPKTKAKLPEKGGWVPAENYWLRRKGDGSVREAEPPKTIPITEEKAKPKVTWDKPKARG